MNERKNIDIVKNLLSSYENTEDLNAIPLVHNFMIDEENRIRVGIVKSPENIYFLRQSLSIGDTKSIYKVNLRNKDFFRLEGVDSKLSSILGSMSLLYGMPKFKYTKYIDTYFAVDPDYEMEYRYRTNDSFYCRFYAPEKLPMLANLSSIFYSLLSNKLINGEKPYLSFDDMFMLDKKESKDTIQVIYTLDRSYIIRVHKDSKQNKLKGLISDELVYVYYLVDKVIIDKYIEEGKLKKEDIPEKEVGSIATLYNYVQFDSVMLLYLSNQISGYKVPFTFIVDFLSEKIDVILNRDTTKYNAGQLELLSVIFSTILKEIRKINKIEISSLKERDLFRDAIERRDLERIIKIISKGEIQDELQTTIYDKYFIKNNTKEIRINFSMAISRLKELIFNGLYNGNIETPKAYKYDRKKHNIILNTQLLLSEEEISDSFVFDNIIMPLFINVFDEKYKNDKEKEAAYNFLFKITSGAIQDTFSTSESFILSSDRLNPNSIKIKYGYLFRYLCEWYKDLLMNTNYQNNYDLIDVIELDESVVAQYVNEGENVDDFIVFNLDKLGITDEDKRAIGEIYIRINNLVKTSKFKASDLYDYIGYSKKNEKTKTEEEKQNMFTAKLLTSLALKGAVPDINDFVSEHKAYIPGIISILCCNILACSRTINKNFQIRRVLKDGEQHILFYLSDVALYQRNLPNNVITYKLLDSGMHPNDSKILGCVCYLTYMKNLNKTIIKLPLISEVSTSREYQEFSDEYKGYYTCFDIKDTSIYVRDY